jgi:DNA invertase Pin-like site-specific DNA recombinase
MGTSHKGGMLVGYARVSTEDQNLDLQKDALQKAGCEKLFTDIASGAKDERAGLTEAIAFLRPGDTLTVWKLDRLGRSLKHLIETVTTLQAKKIGFRSLQESIDTTTSGGKLIFHVFGALAEFERDLIRERTQAGLQAARARGRKGGRPRSLDATKLAQARSLHKDPANTIADICATLGISRATFYRHLPPRAETSQADGPRQESVGNARKPVPRSRSRVQPATQSGSGQLKVMKVELWLRVEGNNKYVRGKKKAREEIERLVLSRYGMEKLEEDGWEYELSIPYQTDEELDAIISDEILGEAERIAERRHCFTEADVTSVDDPDRSW